MRGSLLLLLTVLAILSIASLLIGATRLDRESFANGAAWDLIVDSRLPRTCAVLLTGASLAIAGQIMQLIARNRFVEPMTAGTGQSAIAGILIATLIMPGAAIGTKMLFATVAGIVGSLGFFAMIRRLPPTQPMLVPLVGLIYGGIVGAGGTYVAYQADMLQYLEIWTSGDFSGAMRGRYELLWIAGLAAGLSYLVADQFSILGLGEDVSLNLGLPYRHVVTSGLFIISVVAGLTVVTVGMIPFVGLVVPNLVSRLSGDNLRRTLPITALMGACLVMGADVLGRLIIHPFEIPASTIIGVVGAGAILWLINSKDRHAAS